MGTKTVLAIWACDAVVARERKALAAEWRRVKAILARRRALWVAAKAKLGRMIVALKGLRASYKSTRVRCKGLRVSARAMYKKRNRAFVARGTAACACEVK